MTDGAWPGVVWLDSLCSGVFVTREHILTAGHCGSDIAVAEASLQEGVERFTLVGCIPHPDAAFGAGTDIQICKTVSPAPDDWLIPVLRPSDLGDSPKPETATVVGYGLTDLDGQDSGVKREVELPITAWGTELTLGHDDAGSCAGDSGAPAFVSLLDDPPSLRIAGVMSSGYVDECGVGFYVNMTQHEDWLEEVTAPETVFARPVDRGCATSPAAGGEGTRWWVLGLAAIIPIVRTGRRRRHSCFFSPRRNWSGERQPPMA